jgi:hypothetical protein
MLGAAALAHIVRLQAHCTVGFAALAAPSLLALYRHAEASMLGAAGLTFLVAHCHAPKYCA